MLENKSYVNTYYFFSLQPFLCIFINNSGTLCLSWNKAY